MKKKIIALIIVLAIAVGGIASYFIWFKPSSTDGMKSITIIALTNDKKLEKKYKTDKAFLVDIVIEKESELGVTLVDSTYGKFVAGMDSYLANTDKKEFFEILINDVQSPTGISEIPLVDGEVYTFNLTTY